MRNLTRSRLLSHEPFSILFLTRPVINISAIAILLIARKQQIMLMNKAIYQRYKNKSACLKRLIVPGVHGAFYPERIDFWYRA